MGKYARLTNREKRATTAREAGESIKPGVKRSGTPGQDVAQIEEPAERPIAKPF
jgi:hypothetical protein